MKENSFIEKINDYNIKKILLIIGVSIFAFQALYFISIYGINFPQFGDVWIIQPENSDLEYREFLFNELFKETASHIAFFPKLFLLFSLFFDSFNLVNLMYFGWIVLVLSILVIYFLLKQTDKRLTWLVIPISAFVFSPLQHFTFVWAFGGLQWELTLLGTVSAIYFLNKTRLNQKSFAGAVTMGIIATFSLILGLVVWVIGFLSFLKKNITKKWSIVWVCVSIVLFFLYFLNVGSINESTNFDVVFSDKGLTYVLTYLSMPFRLKFPFLNLTAGITTGVLLIGIIIYFLQKKNSTKIIPWIQFALMGVFSSIVSAAGRMGNPELESWLSGHTPYYAAIANLPQIALMVFFALLFLEINKKTEFKFRKILLVILVIFIIIQVISLTPSYYLGWQFGDEFYQKNSLKYSCFSQSPSDTKYCQNIFESININEIYNSNYLLENKLSIFSNDGFNTNFINTSEQLEEKWDSVQNTVVGYGAIETINKQEVLMINEVKISEPFITITGWLLDDESENIDSVYLFLDGKPFLISENLEIRKDVTVNSETIDNVESGWKISFLLGHIDGCHKITIGGIKDDKKIILVDEIQLCKKS